MEVLLLHVTFLLVLTYPSAAVEPPQNVSGDLHSPLNLTTSFSPDEVKDVSWFHKINEIEIRIVKIKNGSFVDDHNGYEQYGNGTTLEIKNLTEKDLGPYMADVTFINDTTNKKGFNVTVRDTDLNIPAPARPTTKYANQRDIENEVKSHITDIIKRQRVVVVLAVVVVLTVVLVCWVKLSKKSSNTYKQDNQEDGVKTRQNKNVVEEENSKNKNEENRDNQEEGQADEDEMEMKEHRNQDEHQNEDNLTPCVPEIGNHKVFGKFKYDKEREQHKEEDEHWNKSKNKEIPLQDTREWDDRVQKVEVEEQKKEDKETDEGHPFLEETDATTVSINRSTDRKQPY